MHHSFSHSNRSDPLLTNEGSFLFTRDASPVWQSLQMFFLSENSCHVVFGELMTFETAFYHQTSAVIYSV